MKMLKSRANATRKPAAKKAKKTAKKKASTKAKAIPARQGASKSVNVPGKIVAGLAARAKLEGFPSWKSFALELLSEDDKV